MDRFKTICQADDRILAAFVGGSFARGTADTYLDLDLYLVTTNAAFAGFAAQRHAFIRRLGEPVFIETFSNPNLAFYILADGIEGELGIGCESDIDSIHSGPYQVLVDKPGILAGRVFTDHAADNAEQTEKLRHLIYVFWHELSHFITAMGRKQLWWAQGQIEALRSCCVNLARLSHNFGDDDAGQEAYFKIEQAMPAELLSGLRATYCRMERPEMIRAVQVLVEFYRKLAVPLAARHGLLYPGQLERVMVQKLEGVSQPD